MLPARFLLASCVLKAKLPCRTYALSKADIAFQELWCGPRYAAAIPAQLFSAVADTDGDEKALSTVWAPKPLRAGAWRAVRRCCEVREEPPRRVPALSPGVSLLASCHGHAKGRPMIIWQLSTLLGARRMTQVRLAALTGIHRNTISKLYRDSWAGIRRDTLDRICTALQVEVGELLVWEEEAAR